MTRRDLRVTNLNVSMAPISALMYAPSLEGPLAIGVFETVDSKGLSRGFALGC